MSSLFPLSFPFFPFSLFRNFLIFFSFPFSVLGFFTRLLSAPFSLFKTHSLFFFPFPNFPFFPLNTRDLRIFSFLLFMILSLSKAGWNLMKSGKEEWKLVKKKSKKDFRPSRSSFYFPYFNRIQALCVAVCFWSEDWVGFNWVGTPTCSSPIQTTHPVPFKTNILQN